MQNKALLDFVRTTCSFDPGEAGYLPFIVDSVLAGWLKPEFVRLLQDWPDTFIIRPRGVTLSGELGNVEHRTAAIAEITESLAVQGVLSGWRDEMVSVSGDFYSEPLFHIERAAARRFGLLSFGAHVNGNTVRNGAPMMWIARRSDTKAIDPGKLDNMVGGRIARSMSVLETLHEECLEEAGITAERATAARTAGTIKVCHEVPEGLHREIIYVHDLYLAPDYEPVCQDGEVAHFMCVPMSEALAQVEAMANGGELTNDAAIVVLDYLIRRGFLSTERSDYIELLRAIKP
jgi:8-oxo-dGTP pyrophosphatase MutT (NUDIX family)